MFLLIGSFWLLSWFLIVTFKLHTARSSVRSWFSNSEFGRGRRDRRRKQNSKKIFCSPHRPAKPIILATRGCQMISTLTLIHRPYTTKFNHMTSLTRFQTCNVRETGQKSWRLKPSLFYSNHGEFDFGKGKIWVRYGKKQQISPEKTKGDRRRQQLRDVGKNKTVLFEKANI